MYLLGILKYFFGPELNELEVNELEVNEFSRSTYLLGFSRYFLGRLEFNEVDEFPFSIEFAWFPSSSLCRVQQQQPKTAMQMTRRKLSKITKTMSHNGLFFSAVPGVPVMSSAPVVTITVVPFGSGSDSVIMEQSIPK